MTVNELIEQLKNYPGDMRVLTLGYEGGYNDVDLKTDSVVFDVNDKDTWYYGPHDYAGYDDDGNPNPGTECVIIGRGK
jgi:hypothetical protein